MSVSMSVILSLSLSVCLTTLLPNRVEADASLLHQLPAYNVQAPMKNPIHTFSGRAIALAGNQAVATYPSPFVGTTLHLYTSTNFGGSVSTLRAPLPKQGCLPLDSPINGSLNSIKLQWNVKDKNADHILCGRVMFWYSPNCWQSNGGYYTDIPGGWENPDPEKFDYKDTEFKDMSSHPHVHSISCDSVEVACDPCSKIMCPRLSTCQASDCGAVWNCQSGTTPCNGNCETAGSPCEDDAEKERSLRQFHPGM